MLFMYYAKCSTCMKAKKWLETHNLQYVARDITEANPSIDEIKTWHRMSGLPIKKFFNTSGQRYRFLQLKNRIMYMNDEDCYRLLATDGMLVKRPLLITDTAVLIGFKENEWAVLLDT